SRRRHTRCYRDWSSDVCSSDLVALALTIGPAVKSKGDARAGSIVVVDARGAYARDSLAAVAALLSSRRLRGVSLDELVASAASEIGRASCRERVQLAGEDEWYR